jgi:nucleoside-diphosphate-sugar epimerase
MRVLVAGASGAIGMPLVRMLCGAGHEVIAIHRSDSGREPLAEVGAVPIQADVLDREGLRQALDGQRADAVIAELTALKKTPLRHKDMAATNGLRIEGTENLLDAARQVGARRFVTQSMVLGYGFGDWGPHVLTEADQFAPPGVGVFETHLAALRLGEAQVLSADDLDGIALRYGLFYGPGPASDALVTVLRRRMLPVMRGSGVLPWVYVDDAAAATVAALDRGERGTAYNVADDEPVSMTGMMTAIAAAVGAPRPLTVPRWMLAPLPYARALATGGLRVSSAKAKAALGWTPSVPTYRDGMHMLAAHYRP